MGSSRRTATADDDAVRCSSQRWAARATAPPKKTPHIGGSHETSYWHRRHLLQGKGCTCVAGLVQASSRHRCPGVGRYRVHLGRLGWQAHRRNDRLVRWSGRRRPVAPSKASFMVNYRVEDLHAVVTALKAEGCNVLEKIDDSEYGKIAWVIDPEGNKVELWQPPAGQ